MEGRGKFGREEVEINKKHALLRCRLGYAGELRDFYDPASWRKDAGLVCFLLSKGNYNQTIPLFRRHDNRNFRSIVCIRNSFMIIEPSRHLQELLDVSRHLYIYIFEKSLTGHHCDGSQTTDFNQMVWRSGKSFRLCEVVDARHSQVIFCFSFLASRR